MNVNLLNPFEEATGRRDGVLVEGEGEGEGVGCGGEGGERRGGTQTVMKAITNDPIK